jgi:hypothetical protein
LNFWFFSFKRKEQADLKSLSSGWADKFATGFFFEFVSEDQAES